jgi:bacillithiol synthase
VGKLNTLGITVITQQLEHMLGNEPYGKELLGMLRGAYTGNNNLAEATRALVNTLFGEYGVVVIEPDSKALKQKFTNVMIDDVLTGINNRLVNETISAMRQQGIEAQVSPREINLFYMREGLRERIERAGGEFRVMNTDIVFTREQIVKEIEENPEKFSPNVVLRPVYQQMVLPNIAYVGGPAEIAYWLQYKAMFDHHKVRFPVLMPRNFVMLFDKAMNERLQKLGVKKEELFVETEELVKSFVRRNSGESLDISTEEEHVKNVYRSLSAKAEKLDPTLKFAVEAELQKQLNAMKSIHGKLMRAEKQRQETSVSQLRKIKEKLFPEGVLQERHDNFIPYYARYGSKMVRLLAGSLDPFEYKLSMLDLEE